MDPLDPRHGTYAGWQAHIKNKIPPCEPCLDARRAYQRQHSYDQQLGRPRRVDPTRVRAHILHLVGNGMTLGRIAEHSGVHPHTVEQIWKGTRAKVSADHSSWLLATPLEPTDTGLVPSIGAVRRLQAMARLGWSADSIAAAANAKGHGLEASALKGIRVNRRTMVRTKTAAAIAAAYDELSMRFPKPGRGVNSLQTRSARVGYLPPLAWDDDAIDDPAARPRTGNAGRQRTGDRVDEAAIERVLAGDIVPTTFAERVEITRRWQARGRSLSELERVTGWKSDRYTAREQAAS